MNNLKLNALTVLISSIIMLGCQNKSKPTANAQKKSESELKEIIKQQVDSLYLEYEKFGFEWIDFYEDEFIAIYPDSPVKKVTKDSLIAQWEGIYEK